MTTQATLQHLPFNYPKPIMAMAKLSNSKSQAWEMMLSLHTICQPITDLRNDAFLACNAVTIPYIRTCRSLERQRQEEAETSLVP